MPFGSAMGMRPGSLSAAAAATGSTASIPFGVEGAVDHLGLGDRKNTLNDFSEGNFTSGESCRARVTSSVWSTRGSYNAVKGLLSGTKALSDPDAKLLARATSLSLDNIVGDVFSMKHAGSKQVEEATKDIKTQINRCFKVITTRVDHSVPMVYVFGQFSDQGGIE